MTENQQINAALTAARTDLAKARHQREAMAIAERRGELIEKRLVERQAAYLLVAMRQAALNIPQAYARRILNLKEPRQAKEILREAMVGLLNTIKDLPNAVSDPDWLAKVEEKDAPRPR